MGGKSAQKKSFRNSKTRSGRKNVLAEQFSRLDYSKICQNLRAGWQTSQKEILEGGGDVDLMNLNFYFTQLIITRNSFNMKWETRLRIVKQQQPL